MNGQTAGEAMSSADIDEIERYIPVGNPDALHQPLRRVIASHRALEAEWDQLKQCVHNADLAYAKGIKDASVNGGYQGQAIAFSEWYKCLKRIIELEAEREALKGCLDALRDAYDDLDSRHSDLQADLTRVRALVGALPGCLDDELDRIYPNVEAYHAVKALLQYRATHEPAQAGGGEE